MIQVIMEVTRTSEEKMMQVISFECSATCECERYGEIYRL